MTLTVVPVIAPQNLLALMNHLNGKNLLSPAEPGEVLKLFQEEVGLEPMPRN